MNRRYKDKMIGNDDTRKRPFHFANAGGKVSPVIVSAYSREEAEDILRRMNDDISTIEQEEASEKLDESI